MIVSRSVHIDAPIQTVFSLVSDPRRRAELNPNAKPLAVHVEDDQPLHKGSRCHYRLQVGQRIIDYCTRISDLEPCGRIVAVVESENPIKIEVQTAPEGNGTRLEQSETFEPTETMLESALPDPKDGLNAFIASVLKWVDGDGAFEQRKRQEEALRANLGENLQRWLDAIKTHLESPDRF